MTLLGANPQLYRVQGLGHNTHPGIAYTHFDMMEAADTGDDSSNFLN